MRTRDPHFPPNPTILPLGGIPGSNSRIPTLGNNPNRGAPAPPGFMTVTVLSTSSSSGLCVCPYTMISASGNASCNVAGVEAGWAPDPRGPLDEPLYFTNCLTKSRTFCRSRRNTPPVPPQVPLSPNEVTAAITLLLPK